MENSSIETGLIKNRKATERELFRLPISSGILSGRYLKKGKWNKVVTRFSA
jgi:predicted DNA-binding protein (MmcQ/YjbR family)